MFPTEKAERVRFGRHVTVQKAFTGEDAYLWCHSCSASICTQHRCDITRNPLSILSIILLLPTSMFRWKHKHLPVCRMVLFNSLQLRTHQRTATRQNKKPLSQASTYSGSILVMPKSYWTFVRHSGKARELKRCNCIQDPLIPVGRSHRHRHGTTKCCRQEIMKGKKNLWTFKK